MTSVKSLQKQLLAAVAMVLVAAIAMSSATYAWFMSNTQVTASSATMTASTAYTLLISEGAKASDGSSAWSTAHEMSVNHVVTETEASTTDGPYYGHSKGDVIPVALVPVSTIGDLNDSNGLDFMKDDEWVTADKTAADANTNVTQGSSYANTFQDAATSDYIVDTFEIKAAQNCQLILDSETSVAGTDTSLEEVLRMALVINDGNADPTVFMYQIDGTSGTTSLNTTYASDGSNGTATADGLKTAIDADGNVASLAAGNLSSGSIITLANGTNSSNGANAIMDNQGTAASVLYNFDIDTADTITVTVYIWIEGCDYDCNALESQVYGSDVVTAALSFSAALPTTTT
jgi:hypothetical protein